MKKFKVGFLGSHSSAAALCSLSILVLLCMACNFGFDKRRTNSDGNSWRTPVPSNRTNNSNVYRASNSTDSYYEDDDYPANTDEGYYPGNTSEEPSETPADPSSPSSPSSSGGGYYIGNWSLTRPNYEFIGGIDLTISDGGSYSWTDNVSQTTYTGSWEMQEGELILKKGYKDSDWRVRVFSPSNKSTTKDQIWVSGAKGSDYSWIEYKGTRKD